MASHGSQALLTMGYMVVIRSPAVNPPLGPHEVEVGAACEAVKPSEQENQQSMLHRTGTYTYVYP